MTRNANWKSALLFACLRSILTGRCVAVCQGNMRVHLSMGNQSTSSHTLKTNDAPYPSRHHLQRTPQLGWCLLSPSPIYAGILSDLLDLTLCRSSADSCSCREFKNAMAVSCQRQHFTALLILQLLFLFALSLMMSLNLGKERCQKGSLFGGEHSRDTYSQHFGQLSLSVLTTVHCKK